MNTDDKFEDQEITEPTASHSEEADQTGPEDPQKRNMDFYVQTIESLRKERDEYYDLLLRKQADFENYRKRVVKEKEDDRFSALAGLIRELLPVIDSFEKGLASLEAQPSEPRLQTYLEGFELLLKQLKAFLEKFDVTEVPAIGTRFDPNLHEAVLREVTSDHTEGEILEEYRKGYKIGDRLLRASQVKVAVQPETIDKQQ
ncbi:MAG: nucleotide exchange factor GrpE [Acidobacteriota bacterium]